MSEAASCSTAFLISIALRPRRSSLVTINTSPFPIRSSSRINPGRSLAATDPLICSSINRWGLMAKPAASISRCWFSVVCSRVENGNSITDDEKAGQLPETEWSGKGSEGDWPHRKVIDWFQDSSLRRRVQAGLNKGEACNALALAVFMHRQGEIRDRRLENQSYRASGLTLLTTEISLWNTVYRRKSHRFSEAQRDPTK